MFVFRKIWRALFSGNTRFEICPFTLLPTICDVTATLTSLVHLQTLFLLINE